MSKTSSGAASEARLERTEKPRVPQVIGYVDEGAQLDNILSSLTENKPREPEQTDFPDDIFNSAEENADDMPEETEENKLAEPIYEEDSAKTDGYPAREDIDESDEITDNPRFSEPNFTEIPSFEQTREDITGESVTENNEPAPDAEGATNNSPTSPRSDFAAHGTVSENAPKRSTVSRLAARNTANSSRGAASPTTARPKIPAGISFARAAKPNRAISPSLFTTRSGTLRSATRAEARWRFGFIRQEKRFPLSERRLLSPK